MKAVGRYNMLQKCVFFCVYIFLVLLDQRQTLEDNLLININSTQLHLYSSRVKFIKHRQKKKKKWTTINRNLTKTKNYNNKTIKCCK